MEAGRKGVPDGVCVSRPQFWIRAIGGERRTRDGQRGEKKRLKPMIILLTKKAVKHFAAREGGGYKKLKLLTRKSPSDLAC